MSFKQTVLRHLLCYQRTQWLMSQWQLLPLPNKNSVNESELGLEIKMKGKIMKDSLL